MKIMRNIAKKCIGQAPMLAIMGAAIVGILVIVMVPLMLAGSSIRASINKLEGEGYVVLSSAEYNTLNSKLDDIKSAALAAVTAAENAVVVAQTAADKVDLFNSAPVYLFPATTNLTCSLTAGDTNVWSSWVELQDSGTNTLSDVFAVDAGYVGDMLFFLPSDAADGYSVELAYGESKTILGRCAFWALADGDVAYVLPIKSRKVPTGETIYYRMQSTGENNATIQARFRYFYE